MISRKLPAANPKQLRKKQRTETSKKAKHKWLNGEGSRKTSKQLDISYTISDLINYFFKLFDMDIIVYIVAQTNL